MAVRLVAARRRALGCWLAAGLLALTGCATPPAPAAQADPAALVAAPAADAPALPSQPSATAAPPAPAASAPASRSRLADFIARRLHQPVEPPAPVAAPPEPEPAPVPDTPVDEKYQLTGEAARELERGHASWYGGQFHGRRTASGEPYDKYALTAAHKTLPFGTIVRVRSLALGREVEVRINDRGPFSPGRVIDVSQAAAEALGLVGSGGGQVSLNVAGPARHAGAARKAAKAAPRPAAQARPPRRR